MTPTRVIFACFALVALPTEASGAELQTRYGILRTDDSNLLLFRGLSVKPRIEGNNFLTFEKAYEFPGYDLILVQDVGGAACPTQLYVVRVSSAGAAASTQFGTCSDIFQVERNSSGLTVRMRGFMGPAAGEAAQSRAALKKFSYRYAAGKIVEKRIR